MSKHKEDAGNTMFLWVCLMVGVLLVIPAWYAARAGVINTFLLGIAKLQLLPFIAFSAEAQGAVERIQSVDPSTLTWENVMAVLRYSGQWIRWPYILILSALGVAALFMSRTSDLTRRLNMDNLLTHNAESFACLRPVVGRGKYLLSPESYDIGYWRIARTPVQFALEHGLLVDKDGRTFEEHEALRRGLAHADMHAFGKAYLDEEKTYTVLEAQLGAKLCDYNALRGERMALASAFLAYSVGEKQTCLTLLDALSSSYTEKHVPVCPIVEDVAFKNTLLTTWETHKAILIDPLITRHTAFELPWFMALLTLARRKGVLASSQFLWLRPVDRSLWYALNQCGGRAAWAEGFAAWAQYAAEEKAGKPLSTPHITHAVTRLRDNLAAQGWLTEMPRLFVAPGLHLDTNVVFAAAEESMDEYDANEDAILHNELY